ncbi:hypothetical protein Phou_081220 [Phytohabitans houttuyneae]|uniref:ABC transporter domain-containing protein n=2 Tax=Phytohabitans houttuyneae TaxID=1076126 RepID=A0A6V8KFF4_9ACTN|nr:hypothetical protein Phou_081220 [Phytohabitans houttuyneae]
MEQRAVAPAPAVAASSGGRIELVDLCKRYGANEPPAVDHVNIDIEPGEFITLLGPAARERPRRST